MTAKKIRLTLEECTAKDLMKKYIAQQIQAYYERNGAEDVYASVCLIPRKQCHAPEFNGQWFNLLVNFADTRRKAWVYQVLAMPDPKYFEATTEARKAFIAEHIRDLYESRQYVNESLYELSPPRSQRVA
jgi:hypothetical protein